MTGQDYTAIHNFWLLVVAPMVWVVRRRRRR
jgi:hypothetical protein